MGEDPGLCQSFALVGVIGLPGSALDRNGPDLQGAVVSITTALPVPRSVQLVKEREEKKGNFRGRDGRLSMVGSIVS